MSKKIAMIPPVFIEDLMEKDLENLAQGGHDVSSVPYYVPVADNREINYSRDAIAGRNP